MMTRSTAALALVTFGLVACDDAPLLTDAELGQRQSAIVNGNADSEHTAVGVLFSGNITACTATLIGRRTVLTAAHCVLTEKAPYQQLQPIHFYVGGFGGTKYTAASVTPHPGYSGGNRADLAIVHLASEVASATPAVVATAAPRATESIRLVGYGKTSEVGPDDFGIKRVAQNSIGQIFAEYFSVYGASGTIGNLCDGDSGGPTFTTRNGQEILIGVHSTKGGTCGQEGNDMRVDAFHSWIAAEAGGDLHAESAAAPSQSAAQPSSTDEGAGPEAVESKAGFGAACEGSQDCASGLCALDPTSGQRFCTESCDADAATSTCPDASVCHPSTGMGLCGPQQDNGAAPAEEMIEGGCSVGSGPSASGLWVVLMLLAGAVAGRRRAR